MRWVVDELLIRQSLERLTGGSAPKPVPGEEHRIVERQVLLELAGDDRSPEHEVCLLGLGQSGGGHPYTFDISGV